MNETFKEIWEKDAQWLMGPNILNSIISFLKDRCIAVDDVGGGNVAFYIPLPVVRDEFTGTDVSIFHMVPEELKIIFVERLQLALEKYDPELLQRFERLLGAKLTEVTFAGIRSELQNIEQERKARGESELWQVVSEAFGIPTNVTNGVFKTIIVS